METKYTPGPWIINQFSEVEANKSIIGKVYCGDVFPSDHEEGNANAKLIAAAPDLLKACISVDYMPHYISGMSQVWNDGYRAGAVAAFRLLSEVIKKATT